MSLLRMIKKNYIQNYKIKACIKKKMYKKNAKSLFSSRFRTIFRIQKIIMCKYLNNKINCNNSHNKN